MDFNHKIVFITGSSTGIGKAAAIAFAEKGADVIVHCNVSIDDGKAVAKAIQEMGQKALLVQGDVAVKADVERIVEEIKVQFGRIDVLVNNAGSLIQRARLEEMDEELWDRVMAVNLKSVYLVTRAVLPLMKSNRWGRIINLTSIAARNGGSTGSFAYATSKGAVKTLTHAMAKDLAEYNILVNAVAPGIITTPFHDQFSPPELRKTWPSQIPLQREGTPDETAGAIMFLASPWADYITGQIIDVNGGQWMN